MIDTEENTVDEDFHFHLYFSSDTRDSAMAIRERVQPEATFQYDLPPVREQPIGPHRWPLWSIWTDRANFTAALEWMMHNHGAHSVLVHPNIDDGLLDHTDRAMWLGTPQVLNLEAFAEERAA